MSFIVCCDLSSLASFSSSFSMAFGSSALIPPMPTLSIFRSKPWMSAYSRARVSRRAFCFSFFATGKFAPPVMRMDGHAASLR